MRTKIVIVSVIILAITLGCNSNRGRKLVRQNEIIKIIFATGFCSAGECPSQAIEIDRSLSVKYYGIGNTNKVGFYTGKVSETFWDLLNIKIEESQFKTIDSISYNHPDNMPTEVFIYYGNNEVKHIYGFLSGLPHDLNIAYSWLISSIQKMDLNQTKDSIYFLTKVQKPIPPLPIR